MSPLSDKNLKSEKSASQNQQNWKFECVNSFYSKKEAICQKARERPGISEKD